MKKKLSPNKKKWLRRIIYFAIVAGTAGFAFYQHKKSQKSALLAEKKALIFPSLELSQIKAFSIEKKELAFHVFQKRKNWYINSPVQDIADADLVTDWLENLLAEKVRILKKKEVNWAEYDLDKNIKSIEITKKSEEKLKVNISNYSAFDGRFYLRKKEELLLGNISWAKLIDKEGDYFRSYKLLNKKDRPVGLVYHSRLFKVRLKGDNYKWKWDIDPAGGVVEGANSLFPLSQSDLESYWSSLSEVSFMKESYPRTKKTIKKYKLNKPDVELSLRFKDSADWVVQISPKIKGKFYALVSTRDYIFALDKDQMEKIVLTKKTIRDHHQPFQFKKEQVYFVDLKGYGLEVQLKKEKGKWRLLSKDEAQTNKVQVDEAQASNIEQNKTTDGNEANLKNKKKSLDHKSQEKKLNQEELNQSGLNQDELKNILNRIPVLSAKEYFGSKNFKKTADIILKNKENQEILKLEFSAPFKQKVDKGGGKKSSDKEKESKDTQLVYAVSSKGTEVMALDFSALQFIFSPDLFHPYSKK